MSARILIVDDHEVVRQGVRSVLAHSRPHWEICGEAGDGNQAIEATQALQPDVVILDITMPKMSARDRRADREAARQLPHFELYHARIGQD